MRYLKYSEFYITNVCNQNCTGCNRYNNYAFKGHYLWEDHKEDYIKWSKLVDIELIGILGGEPLGNPDFLNWLHGIAELWPNADITIVTNGTYFDQWPNLYEELSQYGNRILIEVSHHTPGSWIQSIESHPKIFKQLKSLTPTRNTIDPKNSEFYRLTYTDKSGMRLWLTSEWFFGDSALIRNELTNELTLHDSDPDEAADICAFHNAGCHHFIAGKLYKCGPVGLLPTFTKQFKVTVTEKQQQLINDYKPAEADWPEEDLTQFIDNLNNKVVIPQCSLCPSNQEQVKFSASTKKIKIEAVCE